MTTVVRARTLELRAIGVLKLLFHRVHIDRSKGDQLYLMLAAFLNVNLDHSHPSIIEQLPFGE